MSNGVIKFPYPKPNQEDAYQTPFLDRIDDVPKTVFQTSDYIGGRGLAGILKHAGADEITHPGINKVIAGVLAGIQEASFIPLTYDKREKDIVQRPKKLERRMVDPYFMTLSPHALCSQIRARLSHVIGTVAPAFGVDTSSLVKKVLPTAPMNFSLIEHSPDGYANHFDGVDLIDFETRTFLNGLNPQIANALNDSLLILGGDILRRAELSGPSTHRDLDLLAHRFQNGDLKGESRVKYSTLNPADLAKMVAERGHGITFSVAVHHPELFNLAS